MNTYKINLDGYFDIFDNDDIRIKGTRIGIETILDDYLNATSPEEIAIRYRSLTLEHVYATITYYLRNKEKIDQYMNRWRNFVEESWQEQQRNPSPAIIRLRNLKQKRQNMLKGSLNE